MKFPTFPTIINDCLKLAIADLKRGGCFVPDAVAVGTVSWNNGKSSIRVKVDNLKMVMSLDYVVNGKTPMRYDVRIATRTANIGRGVIRYFICPKTNSRCRNLYLHGGVFVSRKAISGAMYQTQIESKQMRLWRQLLIEPERRKYGKEFYRGKLTPYGKRLRRNDKYWQRHDRILSLLYQ